MNHQPFEDWLLNDELLNPQQKRSLQSHLRACATCVALAEVKLALGSVKLAETPPGFADRFKTRLAAHKKAQRRRQRWGFLVLAVSGLGALTGLSWPVLVHVISSPVEILSGWISSLASLWVMIRALVEAVSVVLAVIPEFVPAYVWVIFVSTMIGWSLVWVASISRYANSPQGVR